MKDGNFNKRYITDLLRLHKKLTISQLAEITRLSRPTIYLHLESLEKNNFIKRTKDPKKKGAPVTIELIENSVGKKDKRELIEYLKLIKEKNPTDIELAKLKQKFPNYASIQASFLGFVNSKIFLTQKGEQFLKENQ